MPTWAKVLITILVVVTMPAWILVVVVLAPFVIAYEEMWGRNREMPGKNVDG